MVVGQFETDPLPELSAKGAALTPEETKEFNETLPATKVSDNCATSVR
jgi:hypothetical protein